MKYILFVLLFVCIIAPAFILAQDNPPKQAPLVAVKLYTPDSAVKFAAADIATLPPEEAKFTRYLSLYSIPPERRRAYGQTLSFVVNSLSQRRRIYIPVFVGGTDETLIRINIENYDWDAQSWENLGKKGSGVKPQAEPYFHALIEKIDSTTKLERKTITRKKKVETGYYNQAGQKLYREVEVTEEVDVEVKGDPVKNRVLAAAPWVDPVAIAALIKATNSEFPVMRADWFIIKATLPPAYYDFLKLGDDIKDFERLIFTDQKLAEKARSQFKGVVVTSIVARNNRTLLRSPTFTNGYYWQSHDSLSSVDDRQYVQNILNEKFDATEDIGTLPNGLQAYFLTDGKGKRLDFANPDVAIDNTAVDRIVRTGRSCMICHSEGIKPIDDEIRTLTKKLQNKEAIKLLIANKEDAFKIDDLFGTDLDKQIIKDQNIFSEAVAETTGLPMDVNAKQYAAIYDWYAEHLLTVEDVVREVGLPPDLLEKYVRLSNDNVILGLVKQPIRPIRRDQWERSFQGFMIIVIAAQQGAVPIQPQPPFVKQTQ